MACAESLGRQCRPARPAFQERQASRPLRHVFLLANCPILHSGLRSQALVPRKRYPLSSRRQNLLKSDAGAHYFPTSPNSNLLRSSKRRILGCGRRGAPAAAPAPAPARSCGPRPARCRRAAGPAACIIDRCSFLGQPRPERHSGSSWRRTRGPGSSSSPASCGHPGCCP